MPNTVTLSRGDSYSLTTGRVTRNDRSEPVALPVSFSLGHMIARNDLRALSVFFRNQGRK